MVKFFFLLFVGLVGWGGLGLAADAVLLKDDFDSYAVGELDESALWLSPVPETNSLLTWFTSPGGGLQEIREAAEAGRPGRVFAYRETAEGEHRTFSYVQLPEPCTNSKTWTVSVDFYIESLVEPGLAFAIVSLFDGDVKGGKMLTSVALGRNSKTDRIQTSVSHGGETSFFRGNLAEKTWYTLTITGNNGTQAMDFTIQGNGYDQAVSGRSYASNTGQFDIVAIGDTSQNRWSDGRQNIVYLDNLEVTAKASAN